MLTKIPIKLFAYRTFLKFSFIFLYSNFVGSIRYKFAVLHCRPPIISVPVAMASPSLLYPQCSCAKPFSAVCCTKIYINLNTYVVHVAEIFVHAVCLCCRLCVCQSWLNNLTTTTTTITDRKSIQQIHNSSIQLNLNSMRHRNSVR